MHLRFEMSPMGGFVSTSCTIEENRFSANLDESISVNSGDEFASFVNVVRNDVRFRKCDGRSKIFSRVSR